MVDSRYRDIEHLQLEGWLQRALAHHAVKPKPGRMGVSIHHDPRRLRFQQLSPQSLPLPGASTSASRFGILSMATLSFTTPAQLAVKLGIEIEIDAGTGDNMIDTTFRVCRPRMQSWYVLLPPPLLVLLSASFNDVQQHDHNPRSLSLFSTDSDKSLGFRGAENH